MAQDRRVAYCCCRRQQRGIALRRATNHPPRDNQHFFFCQSLVRCEIAKALNGAPWRHLSVENLLFDIHRPGPGLLIRLQRDRCFLPWQLAQRFKKMREISRE